MATHWQWFRVLFEGKKVSEIIKLPSKPSVLTKNTFGLYRYYSSHQTCEDFKRTVATLLITWNVLVYLARFADSNIVNTCQP